MVETLFINNKHQDNIDNFYQSDYYYVNLMELKKLGIIIDNKYSNSDFIKKYGWDYYIFYEIFNIKTYYLDNFVKINKGDVVVDLGANIGIFNRFAYLEGATIVISIEPDIDYYNLLKLNANPKSILYNLAVSNFIGDTVLFKGNHLGGSSIVDRKHTKNGYKVNSISIDYLFDLNIFSEIDFLKIDIEGAEILAFEGISDANLKKIKNISLEYHHYLNGYNENIRQNLITRLVNSGFNSHTLFYEFDNSIQMIYFYK